VYRRRFVAVSVAVALTVAGSTAVTLDTATRSAQAAPSSDAVLRIGQPLSSVQGGQAFELDPAKSDLLQIAYLRLIYDTLLHQAADGSLVPGLATEWNVVDGNTLDLTLRKGVLFQDGEPLTAQAVKESLERKLANPLPNDPASTKALESVEVTGDLKVRIHLKEPIAGAYLNALAGSVQTMVASPKAAAAGTLSEHPVGAGPFRYEDYQPEQQLSLRRFPKYWDAKHYKLAGVDFVQSAADPNANLTALFADQTDVQSITQAQVAAVEQRTGFSVTKQPSQDSYYFLAICASEPPFDNADFRQALQFAIDREELNQVVTEGTGVLAYMGWPKGSQYYVPSISKRWSYSPKKAKRLLRKAGAPEGTSFDFIVPAVADFERIGVVIKDQLAKVGLDVVVQPSANIPVDLYQNKQAPITLSQNVFPGVDRLTRRFSLESAGNWCQYDDPQIIKLLDEISSGLASPAETKALWADVQNRVADFGAPIFLFFSSLLVAHADDVVGLEHIYPAGQGFDLEGVSIKR
jgi:peptide/nickel transport system substrate-binding protein